MIDPRNDSLNKILNTIYPQFTLAQDRGMKLYTLTFRFNGLKGFKSCGKGERLAEERVLFWFKGVLSRVYARPWREELFAYVFFDLGGDGISGPHAHALLAISDRGYRQRYDGLSFDQCFNGDEYGRWIVPADSRGNRDLLKGYWVKPWDGESALVKYSAKSYEWGGSFYMSSPVYITGELCTPEHVREKRRAEQILTL